MQNPRRCHKPKSIASKHMRAQVHPHNVHARLQYSVVLIKFSYSRPCPVPLARPVPKGAGRGREYENMSSRAFHVKHHAS